MVRPISPLAIARRNKGYRQRNVAEHMGVDITTVSKWETGESKCSPEYVRKYAAFIGLKPEDVRPDLNPDYIP